MMPTEDDLKRMFESVDAPGGSGGSGGIDAARVIRRSRARRLPKQFAAGAGGALAIVGVTVLGLQSVQVGGPVSTADAPAIQEYDAESGGADDATMSMKRVPASGINACGQPVLDYEPNFVGLVARVVFPATAPASSERIDGAVILTNESTEPVSGSMLVAPAITLSQDGITLWHTNGAVDTFGIPVDLDPGASMELPASFEPVRCEAEDDTLETFRAGLPQVGPGTYEVSAALDFSSDQITETTEAFLILGPRSPIVLE